MLLFDGQKVRARLRRGEDAGMIVVSFQNRRPFNQRLDASGFGERFFHKYGLSNVQITVSDNHWYQVDEMEPMIAAIREITRAYGRVVTYGSSMGGFGAAMFSGALDADAVICLSPVFSVNPKKVPFEMRWRRDLPVIGGSFLYDDLGKGARRSARAVLLFDPRINDRIHAERMGACFDDPLLLPLPFSGHTCGAFLVQTGLLSGLTRSALDGSLDPKELRKRVREARGRSPFYWRNLALKARRSHPRLAMLAVNRAAEMAPKDQSISLARTRIERGS